MVNKKSVQQNFIADRNEFWANCLALQIFFESNNGETFFRKKYIPLPEDRKIG
jgi:hypothetical protein